MNVLFVTWDGPQVSYLESLFLPIFQRLSIYGINFHVLQFTWGADEVFKAREAACLSTGVSYRAVKIWRTPRVLALLSGFKGSWHVQKAVRDFRIDVVMPRSIMPSLATLLALRNTQIPLVFDSDGLALDERVEFAGLSHSGLLYRFLRDIEAQAVRKAHTVLTRSAKASDILLSRAGAGCSLSKFFEVTNGRDENLFKPQAPETRIEFRRRLGIADDAFVLVYAGSMGSKYCLHQMLYLFRRVSESIPNAHFLFLTGSPELVKMVTDKELDILSRITIKSVSFNEVPFFLSSSNVGLAIIEPSFSTQAVVATKLGEYLLCGLPVVATRAIGDTSYIGSDVGFLLDEHSDVDLDAAASWIIDYVFNHSATIQPKARALGVERFSLSRSVMDYRRAIEPLVNAVDT